MSLTKDSQKQSSKRGWLRPFVEPLRPIFKEVLTVSFFANLLAVAVPVFVLQVYDRVVFHSGLSTLQGLVIGMIVVIAFDYILRQTRAKILQNVALRIDISVGRRLFEKVMAVPLRTLESKPASHWQLLFRDVENVRNTLSGATAILAADLPFAIMFLGVVFIIAMPIAWVLVLVFLVFLALAWRSGNVVADAAEAEKSKTISRDGFIAELIMGRTTIKALHMAEHMRPLWEERQAETITKSIERGTQTDRFVNAGHGLTMFTTVVMTTVGAVAIMNQELTIGGLIAANMLSGRLLGPLNQLVGAWRAYATFLQSVDRLGSMFSEKEELQTSHVSLARPNGKITLEDVTFRYAEANPAVINGIRLHISPTGITAVMGPNASGKTTLLKIILGLYSPTSGRVLLDGADLAQSSRHDLSRWMGYVPQECVLFDGTIRDNIAQSMPHASDEEIVHAARISQAHTLIAKLPDGYGTLVGEAGGLMSGGARQRIAIARAVVHDPSVLVMDEPSGSLDQQAEEALRDSLTELSINRPVVIVTHSPILLQACTHLVIMEAGKIRASGPTKKVMALLSAQDANTEVKVAQNSKSHKKATDLPVKITKLSGPPPNLPEASVKSKSANGIPPQSKTRRKNKGEQPA